VQLSSLGIDVFVTVWPSQLLYQSSSCYSVFTCKAIHYR